MALKRLAQRGNPANVRESAKGLSRTAQNHCNFRLDFAGLLRGQHDQRKCESGRRQWGDRLLWQFGHRSDEVPQRSANITNLPLHPGDLISRIECRRSATGIDLLVRFPAHAHTLPAHKSRSSATKADSHSWTYHQERSRPLIISRTDLLEPLAPAATQCSVGLSTSKRRLLILSSCQILSGRQPSRSLLRIVAAVTCPSKPARSSSSPTSNTCAENKAVPSLGVNQPVVCSQTDRGPRALNSLSEAV
jgi:hypothetical protein